MHDFLEQFDALIAEGRVWYETGARVESEYFPFLFSVAGSFIGRGLSGDEFRSWYRWNFQKVFKERPAVADVEQASGRANGEFFALRRLGLLVPVKDSGLASFWASFIPTPDVLRRVLMTSEEVETWMEDVWKTFRALSPDVFRNASPEDENAVQGWLCAQLSPEAVEAFRRCYQVADDLERKLEATPSGV